MLKYLAVEKVPDARPQSRGDGGVRIMYVEEAEIRERSRWCLIDGSG